jgi:hypothetical protein
MSFETDTLHIIAPLDPNEGDRYNEPMNEDVELIIENIYQITGCIGRIISIPQWMVS